MNLFGLIIGFGAFLIIGLLHPIVIKAEYYLGKRCWPVFALIGVICCILSIMLENIFISALLGVFSFSLFWSIHELFEQEQRVQKGWYPNNPDKFLKSRPDDKNDALK